MTMHSCLGHWHGAKFQKAELLHMCERTIASSAHTQVNAYAHAHYKWIYFYIKMWYRKARIQTLHGSVVQFCLNTNKIIKFFEFSLNCIEKIIYKLSTFDTLIALKFPCKISKMCLVIASEKPRILTIILHYLQFLSKTGIVVCGCRTPIKYLKSKLSSLGW